MNGETALFLCEMRRGKEGGVRVLCVVCCVLCVVRLLVLRFADRLFVRSFVRSFARSFVRLLHGTSLSSALLVVCLMADVILANSSCERVRLGAG